MAKRVPREVFRRRINPYYQDMSKRQVTADVSKSVVLWLVVTVLAYGYWFFLLMLLSLILLGIWHVAFTQILVYSGILCALTSMVFAAMQVHKRFYY